MSQPDPMVFVVDDDESVRKGLTRLIKSAGLNIETHPSARDFLDREPHPGPSCLVLDINMPGLTGLDLQEELTKAKLVPPIIFLTGHGDIPTSVKAMKKGAADFLTKPVNDHDLLNAIKSALEKDRQAKIEWQDQKEVRKRIESLTPREFEVFKLIVTGLLNKQVAAELGISEKTVKVHRGRVMRKMEVESLAELVVIAERSGIN